MSIAGKMSTIILLSDIAPISMISSAAIAAVYGRRNASRTNPITTENPPPECAYPSDRLPAILPGSPQQMKQSRGQNSTISRRHAEKSDFGAALKGG
jgi:hypothetical protein